MSAEGANLGGQFLFWCGGKITTRARSSLVERFSYKEEVEGSIPSAPTKKGTWRSG